jgi:hypothetical protein
LAERERGGDDMGNDEEVCLWVVPSDDDEENDADVV